MLLSSMLLTVYNEEESFGLKTFPPQDTSGEEEQCVQQCPDDWEQEGVEGHGAEELPPPPVASIDHPCLTMGSTL